MRTTGFSKYTFLLLLTLMLPDLLMSATQSDIKVVIRGADANLEENIRNYLPSMRSLHCDSDEARLERYIKAAESKLDNPAEALGYFNSHSTISHQRLQGCWHIRIDVTAGKRLKVSSVNISVHGEGQNEEHFRRLLDDPPYKKNDVFISENYEKYKAALRRNAARFGYLDATFLENKVLVDIHKNTADIHLSFDTGTRYNIGNVEIEQPLLDDKYIKRYVELRQGEPFDSQALIKQQRILENSGYFQSVKVIADADKANQFAVPVKIIATKKKRYTYKGALGYATDDGAYLETSMDVHWLNRKGHQLNVTGRLSEKDPSIGMNYKVPLWNPEHEFANLSLGWERSDNDDIRGTAFKAGFDYHRRNSKDWEQIASLSYLDEETEVDGSSPIRSQLTLLGLNARKTKRNDALFPTEGWRFDIGLRGASEDLLSDQNLVQLTSQVKTLKTFENQNKLILKGNLGYTAVGNFTEMPKSLRFFAGGQNSVRGYSFESLGERETDGDVVGGKHLLTTSVEFERPIKDKFSGALFLDAGNAFNDWNNTSLEIGYGVGVRYRSPLGPIRADFAVPENDSSDIHFYFSLGPDL